jgi:hypothetical protein
MQSIAVEEHTVEPCPEGMTRPPGDRMRHVAHLAESPEKGEAEDRFLGCSYNGVYACFAKVMSDVSIDARTHDKTKNSVWEKLLQSSNKLLALQMGTHNRLGADSPILCLTPCLLM